MLFSETIKLFKLHRRERDYAAAVQVMRRWSQESGARSDLWLAEISLLTLALELKLSTESWHSVERLREMDANDPYLLTLVSRLQLSEGDRNAAVESARQAYENALKENDPGIDGYLADLDRLTQDNNGAH
jgi:hypothetical protein